MMRHSLRGAALALVAVSYLAAGCGLSAPGGHAMESGDRGYALTQAKDLPGEPEAAPQAAPMMARAGDATAPPTGGNGPLPSSEAVRGSAQAASRRVIITTGSVSVEVSSYTEAAAAVTKAATEMGGFVSGSEANVGEEGRRYGTISLRVPAERWSALLDQVRGLGKVLRESSNGLDVTEEYVDLESRLRSQKRLEAELLELMESARRGGLRDLLEIEREVARVRGEIESMEGRRRYLADQAALSTLTVELREPAALVNVEPGAFDPVFEALGESVTLVSRSLGAIIVFVAVLLPWLVAAWLLFILVRWWWRRRK